MRKPFLPLLAAGLTLAACAANAAPQAGTTPGPHPTFGPNGSSAASPSASPTAADGEKIPGPRIVLATPTGIDTRDSQSGQMLSFIRRPLITALSDGGDGSSVIYTETDQFGVFDSGLYLRFDFNGAHYNTDTPLLTKHFYPAPRAGQVTTNLGVLTLFADGTGQAFARPVGSYLNPDAAFPPLQAQSPHAGFAVWVGGDFLLTQGDRSGATGVQVIRDGQPVGEVVDCPQAQAGAPGAGTDHGHVYVVGCQGAFLIYREGELHRVPLPGPAAAARLTDLAGSYNSPWVLARVEGDTTPATQIALIDTRDDSIKLLEVSSPIGAESLARGPGHEGLALTADGQLLIIDPERAATVDQVPVFSAPAGGREPAAPLLQAYGEQAFLLSPARDEVVVLDIASRQIKTRIADLDEIIDMEVVDTLGDMQPVPA
ncbi:hypothetical protein [Buchananella hordeovulneris]|uniref:hypothetical protein n=1 Tax=Buchananella hordeovulneris TaxID=52770 RepID=UPI000F5F4E71|nr:hypothetical protein [Buchananella hordeovulneris]RRD45469.1 hypothetical protein EII13_00980 [Buchananella hordeovulneris]